MVERESGCHGQEMQPERKLRRQKNQVEYRRWRKKQVERERRREEARRWRQEAAEREQDEDFEFGCHWQDEESEYECCWPDEESDYERRWPGEEFEYEYYWQEERDARERRWQEASRRQREAQNTIEEGTWLPPTTVPPQTNERKPRFRTINSGSCRYSDGCAFSHDRAVPGNMKPEHSGAAHAPSPSAALPAVSSVILLALRSRQRRPGRAARIAAEQRRARLELGQRRQERDEHERVQLERELHIQEEIAAAKARERAELEAQAAYTLQAIVSGAIVTFGAGLIVQRVLTLFECCKVPVRNLPHRISNKFAQPLSHYDLDPQHFHATEQRQLASSWEVTVIAQANTPATTNKPEPHGQRLDIELGASNGVGGMRRGAGNRNNPLYFHRAEFAGINMRVALLASVHFTMLIPAAQYCVQKTQWEELISSIADRAASFLAIKEFGDAGAQVQVSGSDKLGVGALKVQVERIAAGVQVPGWHETFTHPSAQLVESIHAVGAYIRGDARTASTRLYGPTPAIAAASALVEEELERLASTEQTIIIPANAAQFFVQRGLEQLKAMYEDVELCYDTALRTLTVKGGQELCHTMQRILEQADTFVATDTSSSNPDASCQICFDTPTAPRVLLCGHVACTRCLQRFFSSTTDPNAIPLVCMGNNAKCKSPFPISLIRDLLDEGAFENMLSLAFAAHQHREFPLCWTTDCSRPPSDAAIKLSCLSCFSMVCVECGEDAHEGKSCERARLAHEQERLTEEGMRGQTEIKRCPSCRAPIIKNEGCNHVACECGAHFRWRCLTVTGRNENFSTIERVHGGIYDPE